MTTTVVKSIGSAGGRDYSTVQAWWDAIPTDITAAGNNTIQIGECYNDSDFTAAGPVLTMSGVTTDSTHYVKLTCHAGQSFSDNASRLSHALYTCNNANGVLLRTTSDNGQPVIYVANTNVFIIGIQAQHYLSGSGYNGHGFAIYSNSSGPGVYIGQCILEGQTDYYAFGACAHLYSGTVANSLLMAHKMSNYGAVSTAVGSNGASPAVHGCTIIHFNSGYDIVADYDSPTIVNSAFYYGAGLRPAYGGHFNSASDYNSTDGSSITGFGESHSLTSQTASNQFINASTDFRVKSGANLIGAGTPDTTYDLGVDIYGQTRSATAQTIGCFEFDPDLNVSITGLGGTGALGTTTGIPAFIDNFNRANENLTANANWSNIGGTDVTSMQVSSNTLVQFSSTLAALCPSQGNVNHSTSATCPGGAAWEGWGFFACVRLTDLNNFWGWYFNATDAGATGGDTGVVLYKRVSGTFTKMGSYVVTGGGVTANDVMKLDATGNVLTVYYNGTSIISVTDSFNNTEMGQGIVAFGTGASNQALDNFIAAPGVSSGTSVTLTGLAGTGAIGTVVIPVNYTFNIVLHKGLRVTII